MTSRVAPQGMRLFIERQGIGPPLVLLHGWGLNLRVFDPLVAQLRGSFACIAIDLPGHGRSVEPPQLAIDGWTAARVATALVDDLPDAAIVLGWSLGGQVALELAAAFPEKVSALVLLASTPRFVADADSGWAQGVAPEVLAGFAMQLQSDLRATIRDFLELQVRGSRHAAATRATLEAALHDHGKAQPGALSRALEMLRTTDLRARLVNITAPALVIGGEHDRLTPPGATRALAAALRSGTHLELPRCGHAPLLSHTDAVGTAIRSFVSALDARAA